jgi:hypothetical protein
MLTALAIGFCLPFLLGEAPVPAGRARQVTWFLLVSAVVALGIGTQQSRFSERQPRPEAVRDELDVDKGSARWTSNDVSLGAWSGQYIPVDSPRLAGGSTFPGGPPTFAAPAPLFSLAAPTASTFSDRSAGGRRKVEIGIASGRGAPIMEVKVSARAAIVGAAIAGQPLDLRRFAPATNGELVFYASGFGPEGFPLSLTLARPAPFAVALADMSDGLPGPGRARPRSTMPTPGATIDGTVVRATFRFASAPM